MLDPTFAEHARTMLRAIAGDHQLVEPDDPGADVACSAGDELDPDMPFQQHLLDVIALAVAEAPSAAHVVHVADAFEDLAEERVASEDSDDAGDPRRKGSTVKGRHYAGPIDCPDCGHGLTSRGTDMICPRLSRDTAMRGCHDGCVVACGVARDG